MLKCDLCNRRVGVVGYPCRCDFSVHPECFKWHSFLYGLSVYKCKKCDAQYEFAKNHELYFVNFIISLTLVLGIKYLNPFAGLVCILGLMFALLIEPLNLKNKIKIPLHVAWILFLIVYKPDEKPLLTDYSLGIVYLIFVVYRHVQYIPMLQHDVITISN